MNIENKILSNWRKPRKVKDSYFAFDRVEMMSFLPQNYSKILEVGCGTGAFLENIRDDVEKWGVELSSEAAALAAEKKIHVIVGEFQSVLDEIPDDYFDVVIFNDVIEHCADTDLLIFQARSKLAVGGVFVGSIPNVRYVENLYEVLFKKDWEYVDAGILDRTHLRFFTKKSTERLFVRNQLRIEKMEGINSIFKPMRSVRRCLMAVLALFFVCLTLGYYRDCIYLQFAFRLSRITDND